MAVMPNLWAESLDQHRRMVLSRILDAYGRLHGEHGFDGVTLSAVAGEAGLARSAIYNYVEDKHDLALTHAERGVAEAHAELAEAIAAADGPLGRLEAYVRLAITGHARWTGSGDDLMPLLSEEEQRRMLVALDPLRTLLVDVVAGGIEAGALRGPLGDTMGFVWAIVSGYRMPVAGGHVDPDAAADTACALLLDGVRADLG